MAAGLGRLDDPDDYLRLARSLAEGRGFALDGRATAYRPPLYPILLAPIVRHLGRDHWAWGIGGLHLLLGVGTVGFVLVAARRWGYSRVRVLAAGLIVALDPVLVGQARAVMTETLAAFLVAAGLAGLGRPGWRGAIAGGLAFGLGALCRPSLLPAAGAIALVAPVASPGTARRRVGLASAFLVATLVPIAPWALRNWVALGEPIATTTHGGWTLRLANNSVYYEEVVAGPPGATWSGPRQAAWFAAANREVAGMAEPAADRVHRAAAVAFIRARPDAFAWATLGRFGRFWGVSPSGSAYSARVRLASASWTIPLWVALGLGWGRRPSWAWPALAAGATIATLGLIHLAYWTDLRMRAPLVPAFALIAANAGLGRRSGRGPGRAKPVDDRSRGSA